MAPVSGSLEPCRTAGGGGGEGGETTSSSSSNNNNNNINININNHTNSSEKKIDNDEKKNSSTENQFGSNDKNHNNCCNGNGIHSGGRPAQKWRTVPPALPLRYVQQTATQPAHYVYPRSVNTAAEPSAEVVKDQGWKKEKQKQKERKKSNEREKKPKEKEKEKEKDAQKGKGKEVKGAQKASKGKASRSRAPKSPTTATAAAQQVTPPLDAGDSSHAAAASAAPTAPDPDASSQSSEAAPKPCPQATNGSGHTGNKARGHSVEPAPVIPAEHTSPAGDATSHHSRQSSATETSAESGGSAAQDSVPSEMTSQDNQGLGPPKDSSAQHPSATLASPRPPAAASPTQDQPIHPSFQHAPPNQPVGTVMNGDLPYTSQPPMPAGPRMHQAHPSNASGLYGPLHGSQSSSPAPPFVGGLPPPPGMPITNGRAPHIVHLNGPAFHPLPPFGTDMIPGSGWDNFPGPAAMPFGGSMDLRPHGSALGHSGPHSFHGSQSSVHPEENGMFPQYPPGLRNGAPGPGEDQRGAMGRNIGSLDFGRMGPNPGVPFRDMVADDHVDALVAHIQRHFSSPELTDCYLELRYADDRAPPMRVSGHRLVFSRSLPLAELVRKQSFQTGPADGAPQTLLLETQSQWIRSDSFYLALQYLYGLPLFRPPTWRDDASGREVTIAGSAIDQFEFAISYAAAGDLLVENRILGRGCEIAAQVLTWETLERALAFALENYTDKGSYEPYRYGDGSRILLNAVVTFIIQHFPPNFTLNVDSKEPVPFARFPTGLLPSPPTSQTSQSVDSSDPAEASRQIGGAHKARKLSSIQFGDLPCAAEEDDEPPKPPSPAEAASYSTLSRILLDIPFPQLKAILESPGTGNVHAWANAEARYKIIKSAVDEREARRRRALEAILAGRGPDAGRIREGLRRLEPQDLGPLTAVGWQEDVLPYGNANGPSLGRRWAPIMEPPTGSTTAYP